MNIKEKVIRRNSDVGSGRVKQYLLPGGKKITQITTFCPDIIGPGPTNLYVIEDKRLILVDTGIPTHLAKKIFYYWRRQYMPPEVKALPDDYSEMELVSGLEAAGYSLDDIEVLIITHGHVDHYLVGTTIVEKNQVKVSAHVLDTERICNPWALSKNVLLGRPRYAAMGMPIPTYSAQEFHGRIDMESDRLALRVDYPISVDGPLSLGGVESDDIIVRHFPGHSPGSISLIIGSGEDKVLICGDTLLYPITPHPDDLVAYLRTLDDMEQLEGVAISLPAHGKNIRDLHGRIRFLKRHHHSRLEFTYRACREPKSPWEIASMPRYFDVFVDPKKFNPMAGNEAFIHMELLVMAEGLYRSKIDGSVHYFRNTREKFDDVYARVLDIIDNRESTVL